MSPFSKLSLALLLVLPVFAGCKTMQEPSAGDTVGKSGTGLTDLNAGTSEDLNGLSSRNGTSIPDDLMNRIKTNTLRPEDILVTVYFDFDQYNVRASERPALEAAAKTLAASAGAHVVSVGHTDAYGSDAYNLALSDKRSNSVKSYMIESGGDKPDQIEILALGKLNSVPGAGKESPEAKHDRRVDVVKIPAGAGR